MSLSITALSPVDVSSEFKYFKFPGLGYLLKYNPEPSITPWVKKSYKTKVVKALKPTEIIDMSVMLDSPEGKNEITGIMFITAADRNLWYWDMEMAKPFPLCDTINLGNPNKIGCPKIVVDLIKE